MLIHYTSFWSTLHYKHDNVHNFIFFIFSLDSPRRMQWTWNLSSKHRRMNDEQIFSHFARILLYKNPHETLAWPMPLREGFHF